MKNRSMKILIILIFIPMQLQSAVFTQKQWAEFYLRDCANLSQNQACKQRLEKALGEMIRYKNMTLKYLRKEELPLWFMLIPVVESNYNKIAVSKKNALGLWQIMPYNIEAYKKRKIIFLNRSLEMVPTNGQIKKYGFNPETNTEIATLHFSMLFQKFRYHKETEKLAILAYNAGVTGVKRCMNGGSRLPDETINYYNKIMAVKYIIANMRELGVEPVRKLTIVQRIRGLL